MKAIPDPIKHRLRRALIPVLLAGLTGLSAGCFGRKAAATLVTQMGPATSAAVKATSDLKDAHQKTVIAFNQGIVATASSVETLSSERADALLRAAWQEKMAQLEKDRGDVLGRIAALRRNHVELAYNTIDQELKPIKDLLEERRLIANTAKLASEQFPGDIDRRLKLAQEDRTYLAVYGRGMEIESKGREEMIKRLDALVIEFEAKIDKLAKDARKDMTAKYTTASNALRQNKPQKPNIEPLPTNAEAYATLGSYLATVQKGTTALDDYLRLNSFGRGSFLDELGSSFLKGLPLAFKDVVGGKTTGFDEVLTQSRTVIEQFRSEAVKDLTTSGTELLQQFRTDAGGVGDELAKLLKEQASKLGTEKLKEFGDFVTKLKA